MEESSIMPVGAGKAEATGESIPTEKNAQNRRKSPFMSADGRRDLTAVYRAVFDFHKRNSPPVLDAPTADYDYWAEVGKDFWKTSREFNSDPFVMDMLLSIMKDLEREYSKAKQERTPDV